MTTIDFAPLFRSTGRFRSPDVAAREFGPVEREREWLPAVQHRAHSARTAIA